MNLFPFSDEYIVQYHHLQKIVNILQLHYKYIICITNKGINEINTKGRYE